MTGRHAARQERLRVELVAQRALRCGASNEEAAEASGLSVLEVARMRRFLGLALAATPTKPPAAVLSLAGQRAECLRHLGPVVVDRLAAGDDPVAIQRLYAALRCALLDGEELLPLLREVFREIDLQRVAALTVADGPAAVAPGRARACGGKREVFRGSGEGRR